MNTNLEFEAKTAEDAVDVACKELGVNKKQLKYDVLSHGSTGIFGLVGVKKARIRVYPSSAEAASAKAEPKKGRKPAGPRNKGRNKKALETKDAPLPVEQEPVSLETEPVAISPGPETALASEVAKEIAEETELVMAQEPMESSLIQEEEENGEAPYVAAAEDDPNIEQCMDLAVEASVTMARTIAEETTGAAKVNEDGDIIVSLDCEKPAVLIGRRGQTLDAIQYLVEKIVNRARSTKLRVRVDAGDYLAKREETLTQQAQRLGIKVMKTGKPASFSPMSAHDRRIVHLALKNETGLRTQSRGSGYLRKLIIFPQKDPSRNSS
ncbi:MAG: Jag N-terminal domain-containing protein [Desulfatibacillum sp.]|nr:Jag N-terminal domain-containing protein [Desulfatibacillum sp.]